MTANILFEDKPYFYAYYNHKNACFDQDVGSQDSDSTCEDKTNLDCESRNKLKVQLCKNFIQNKICPYKSRCKFAHGLQELLRNTELSQNFRTKKCKIFYDKKYCKFGQRCNFKHNDSEKDFRKIASSPIILKEYPQLFIGYKSKSKILSWVSQDCQQKTETQTKN